MTGRASSGHDKMNIEGLLIDLDGVIYQGGKAIPGARTTLEFLGKHDIPFRCISNTTRKCRQTICTQLSGMGIDIPQDHIVTPPLTAIAYMRQKRKTRFHLLVTGDVSLDFAGIGGHVPGSTDYVIVGDVGEEATYNNLNTAFRLLMEGAELIALEKDRYWMAQDGLALSAGPFVSALEYATGKTAILMGKPSKTFFDLALKDMALPPERVAMIGDDLLTDVGGAKQAGMKGILVRTGKYREDLLHKSAVAPDVIIGSVADVPDILEG
ncbi:TIGR01458 family HAD-type hydrolase [Methanoregula formicica]|uniref:Haloacid dehalogenase-like hydrolase domain-containing protein 2 n=1 Tax=Methanoregula formicica (strain DSM 22288 / NBRC 105244 / SMSP) TaxID=593750 RepID=L0HKI2_METFS|nr:TIGR01458 family HAD-type hydrolase [Methanoregula formicica]AGB03833.1 HAD-superfamily subfamily IIA hydrolase, TIGR01458 [Methanoregula formicica SMSP]